MKIPKHLPWDGRHRVRMFSYFGSGLWTEREREIMRREESKLYVSEELERLLKSDRRKGVAS